MNPDSHRPLDGVLREDAGRADRAGFIGPSIGALEHALYFTSAPSLVQKTHEVLDQGRLLLPGAVVVWDETIGRRKGSQAVPNAWWAQAGSLTAAFAFRAGASRFDAAGWIARAASAVQREVEAFGPRAALEFRAPNDLLLDGRKLGALAAERHGGADIVYVRLNANPDLAKAPRAIAANACRLADHVDLHQLPIQSSTALANALLQRLMVTLPEALAPQA